LRAPCKRNLLMVAQVPWSVLLGLAVLVVVGMGWLLLQNKRKRAEAVREFLLRRAERLAAEYPDEVAALGGTKVLLNAELAREIIAAVETDMGSPAPP